MDENRIKELAEEYTNLWDMDGAEGWSEKAVADLIRTVAAEARKEGIEEMRSAAKLCNDARRFPAVLSAHEFEVWMNGEIDERAERLKEKGK